MNDLTDIIDSPVRIRNIQFLKSTAGPAFVRIDADNGLTGIACASQQAAFLHPILLKKVIPVFEGKDARELASLINEAERFKSNYKLGFGFWNCIGWLEAAILDLLGKIAEKSVAELLGGIKRTELPVYLSSMRRNTSAEEEVEIAQKRIAETGVNAYKLKIGGRMSKNADASEGRSENLVRLARETFGDAFCIYVDANSSYDAEKAIEVGRMLEYHSIDLFEEPCPWDEYDWTKTVADTLDIPVGLGEQEYRMSAFRKLISERGADLIQPDIYYCGGLLRAVKIAKMAEQQNLPLTPHSPKFDATLAPVLHYFAALKNPGSYLEYNDCEHKTENWYSPFFEIKDGKLTLPTGPGLGVEYEPDWLKKAQPFNG